jgi:hypothetical protein
VIRKQLGAADKSVARRTAVTDGKPPSTETIEREPTKEHQTSTGLMRKISNDGISRLEEIPAPSSPDSAMHRLLDAQVDPDRRTEVGAPPTTGQIPRDSSADIQTQPARPSARLSAQPAPAEPAPSRRGLWLALAVLVLAAGGGFAAWRFSQDQPSPTPIVAVPADAAVEETIEWGTVEIDPDPEGAKGFISDIAGTIPEGGAFGPTSHKTPVRKRVEPNKPFRVHIELEGYDVYDKERTVQPNETLVIAPTLDRARATLVVTTTPPGAQVTLGGSLLGTTPLTRSDLEATPAAELAITRSGFEPYRQKIALAAGKTVEINQTLKAAQRYGTIKLIVKNGWGDVYLKGSRQKIGRAPTPSLRLPVGRQTLHLVNTGKPVEWDVTCDVSDTEQNTCTTQMP